jgi:hypothetical protein
MGRSFPRQRALLRGGDDEQRKGHRKTACAAVGNEVQKENSN